MSNGSKLRVAVPDSLTRLDPATGRGKVWTELLRALGRRVRLQFVEHPSHRRPNRQPDVWLSDHTCFPSNVAQPRVTHVFEAGWNTTELRQFFDPTFLTQIDQKIRLAVRAADRVITISSSSRDQLIDVYELAAERVHIALCGVDRRVFRPRTRGARKLLRKAGLPAGTPYVMFAASVHPRKNLGALRDAMTTLAEQGLPHALVLVVGPAFDRSDSDQLEIAAVADLPGHPGRVFRVERPRDRQLASLMASASAFCLPSFMEGFGLTALEAMACGTPVVVSNRGALPEVVGPDGITVEPEAGAVADALIRLLHSPDEARAVGRAGLERARRLTWSATAGVCEEVLELAVDTK